MNLLIVGGSPNHRGGVEVFCARAAEAIEDHGGHQAKCIPAQTAYLNLRRLPIFCLGLWSLVRHCRSRPDCVWIQYVAFPDLLYVVLAKFMGLRVLVTPHLGSNWRSQSNPLLRTLSGWMLGFADRLALLSPTQEREILLPQEVPRSIIRTFLPKEIWSRGLPNLRGTEAPELQLIHASRLSEGKGTFLFVEVCAELQKLRIPFFAKIAGGADATTMSRLNSMIVENELEGKIVVLGHLGQQDMITLLQTSDVLVHLSKIDSYPLIVLEAISYCTFPICVDLAGASDMITAYTGLAVSAGKSVEETVDFLKLQTPAGLWSLSQDSAAKLRYSYRWDNCVQALELALANTVRPSKV